MNFPQKPSKLARLDPRNLRPSISTARNHAQTQLFPRKAVVFNESHTQKLASSPDFQAIAQSSPQTRKKGSNIMPSLRKSQSFKQSFSESAEISKKQLQEWESFKRNPRFSYLENNPLADQIPQEDLLEVY